MSYQTLQTDLDPRGVMSLSLNRPEVRNAFNEVVIDELDLLFERISGDPTVRVVVFKGNGPVFCAGGDLNWMKKAIHDGYEENLRDTRRLARMFARLNECPKPVVALVHGGAIGGGVGLVSVCDLVIATAGTQFSLSEVRLGLVPACIGPFVVAKVGPSHARALFVSGKRFDAQEACRIGLVHEVVADEAALATAGAKAIQTLLTCGPKAVATAKRLVHDLSWPERRGTLSDPLDYVARTLADIRISPEAQEGTQAFLAKRKPAWDVS